MKKTFRLFVLFAVLFAVVCFASCTKNDSGYTRQLSPVDYSLSDAKFVIGVDKSNKNLLDDVNDFIGEIKKREDGINDSILDTVINNYFGDGTPSAVTSEGFTENTDDVFVVAASPDYAPYEYKEGDAFYGIDMELAALLAEKLSQKLVILEAPFDELYTLVADGKADVVISAAIEDPAQKKIVNFSDSYYTASQIVLIKTDDNTFNGCAAPEEVIAVINARGKDFSVGIQKNTAAEILFNGNNSYFTAENGQGLSNTEMNCEAFDSAKDAVQKLLDGSISCIVTDESVADYLVNLYTLYPSAETTVEKGE